MGDTYALSNSSNRYEFISKKGCPKCQYQSERCLAHALVIVVALGRLRLLQLQIAHNANNQNCNTLHVQRAEHITAVRLLRSDLYSELTQHLGVDVDPNLLALAFTHRSFAYESGAKETNERLEFLGDSVLGLIVTEELFLRFPDLDESRLSPLRSGIVNMRALADIARTLELGKYIRLGKGEEVTNGRDKNSLLGDALEALIGAIYIDSGFATASAVIQRLIKSTLEEAMAKGAGLDGKTALQELVASLGKGTLEYLLAESGPDHDKSFTATAVVGGVEIAQGEGKSKREAEQAAARSAYEKLSS